MTNMINEFKKEEFEFVMRDTFMKFFFIDLFNKVLNSAVSYRIYNLAKDKNIPNEKLYNELIFRFPTNLLLPSRSYYRRRSFIGILNFFGLVVPLSSHNREIEVFVFKFLDEVAPYII